MDPYTFHKFQQAGAFDPAGPDEPADLLELLFDKFLETPFGRQVVQAPAQRGLLVQFLGHCREYLQGNPVVSQGMLDGGLTLIFQEGESVPLVKLDTAANPERPAPTYAVTQPKETRRKGMIGGEDSGAVGVTGRTPRR